MGVRTPDATHGRRRTRPDAIPRTSFLELAHHLLGVPTERGLTAPRGTLSAAGPRRLEPVPAGPRASRTPARRPRVEVPARCARSPASRGARAVRPWPPRTGAAGHGRRGRRPRGTTSGSDLRKRPREHDLRKTTSGKRPPESKRRRGPWREPGVAGDPEGGQAKSETQTVSRRSFCARSLTAGAAAGSCSMRRRFQIATSPLAASRASGASFARSRTDARIARAPS